MKAAARAYFGVLGKSADYGVRTYVAAASADENHHVCYWRETMEAGKMRISACFLAGQL